MTVAQLRRHAFVILASTGNFVVLQRAQAPAAASPGFSRHGGEAVLALSLIVMDAAIAAPPGQALPTTAFPGSHPFPGPTDIFASATVGHRTSL
jgi:hypothetical protein